MKSTDRAKSITADILVNHLPRVQEGLEKGYVDENQILVIYDHAVRSRILNEQAASEALTAAEIPSPEELMGSWYESSAYGDHVPRELPDRITEFLAGHSVHLDEGEAWDVICESNSDHPWTLLMECIFKEGARYAIQTLEDRELIHDQSPSVGDT